MPAQKGFLKSLFDFSFTSLITPRVIKVFYALSLLIIALDALYWAYLGLNLGLNISTTVGLLLVLVVVPIITLLYIIGTRIQYEFIIVVFRILETSTERVRLARQGVATKPTFDATVAAGPSDGSSD